MTILTRYNLIFRVLAAALGGYALNLASPGANLWPVSFFGFGLIVWSVWRQTLPQGALLGFTAGAMFWSPHLDWLTLYLGPVPWLALSAVMTLWFAAFGAAAAYTTRHLHAIQWLRKHPLLLALVEATAVAGLWIMREQVQQSWPYGGFAWGRAALTQANSPLLESVSWVGIAGLSWLLIFTISLVVSTLPKLTVQKFHARSFVISALTFVVFFIAAALVPAAVSGDSHKTTTTLRVAGIQGNAKAGIFDDRESGDVFQSHLDATEEFVNELEATGDKVDIIVWPENSAEFDIREESLRQAQTVSLAKQAEASIVVGSVLRDKSEDGTEKFFNSSLVISPDGTVSGRYDKKYPVPFAEYMPHRSFFRALVPDLVDLVQLDYQAGQRSTTVEVDGAQAGIAICFDVTFDRHSTDLVHSGAEVVFALTNNADFGRTDESAQQLAITRMQGVSMGRALVNISTVGTSEILGPDGSTLDVIPSHVPGAVISDVPLLQGTTPAMLIGGWISTVVIVLGGVLLFIASLVDFSTRPVVPQESH